MIKNLYAPADVEEAFDRWKASCGQGALASILRCSVDDVEGYFPGYAARGYTNPTHMGYALDRARRRWKRTDSERLRYGLAFLQLTGRWTRPGVPIAAAYRHTHWIGCARVEGIMSPLFYDINAGLDTPQRGQWILRGVWEGTILPLLSHGHAGADGGYYIRWACEVEDTGASHE